MIYKENLVVVPSEFKRLSVKRLQNIQKYLDVIIQSVKNVNDPNYGEVANSIANVRVSLKQIEYSFNEINKFLESLSDKVNTIAKEKAQ
jgi:tetrahydromethanopterin S-methyltransferase subunit G